MSRAMLRSGVLALVLAVVGSPATAQIILDTTTGPELVLSAARRVEIQHRTKADQIQGLTRSINAVPGGTGAVAVVDRVKGPGPLGQIIDVDVKRTLPWAKIAKSFAKSLPLISTAVSIAEIAEAIRCREAVGGGAECDSGTNEQTVSQYQCTGTPLPAGGPYTGATIGAAADACSAARLAELNASSTCVWSQYLRVSKYGGTPFEFGYQRRTGASCSGSFEYGNAEYGGTPVSVLACPAVVVNGVTLYPVKGPDGKCMTNLYEPATEDQVAQKAEQWGDKAKAPMIVGELNAAGKPIEHPFPEADPVPGSVQGPRETTAHPDGSTTVRDTRYDLTPTPTGYEWTPAVTTKDYPPGAVIPPPGQIPDGSTTSGGAPAEDIITCGLPNTPACKIDETGTPKAGTISKTEVDEAKADALDRLGEIGQIQAPAWTWSFALPHNCSSITVGPFLSQSVEVDLCQYQPMIHDLVALLWAAFTVWACVAMVGRAFAVG